LLTVPPYCNNICGSDCTLGTDATTNVVDVVVNGNVDAFDNDKPIVPSKFMLFKSFTPFTFNVGDVFAPEAVATDTAIFVPARFAPASGTFAPLVPVIFDASIQNWSVPIENGFNGLGIGAGNR
jgi:hypothetical protein